MTRLIRDKNDHLTSPVKIRCIFVLNLTLIIKTQQQNLNTNWIEHDLSDNDHNDVIFANLQTTDQNKYGMKHDVFKNKSSFHITGRKQKSITPQGNPHIHN